MVCASALRFSDGKICATQETSIIFFLLRMCIVYLIWCFVQSLPERRMEKADLKDRKDAYSSRFSEIEYRALRAYLMNYEESGFFDKW